MGASQWGQMASKLKYNDGDDTLDLCQTKYSPTPFKKFCLALKFNTSLTSLTITGHHNNPKFQLGDDGLKLLCTGLIENDVLT